MDLEPIRLLYAYNRWANERLLDLAEQLTPEQLHAPNEGVFGSVQSTLVHLMETEFFWGSLIWRGKAIGIDWKPFEFDAADYPDVTAIRARWTDVAADMDAFVDELTPEGENSLERIIVWQSEDDILRRRTLWSSMVDFANHATHHRSEIAMALTRHGYPVTDFDISDYMREHMPAPAD